MTDIKIANDFYLPRALIEMYVGYSSNTIKTLVRNMKRDPERSNRLFDFTARKKTGTVIFTVTGKVLLVSTAVDTIKKRIDESEAAALANRDTPPQPRQGKNRK